MQSSTSNSPFYVTVLQTDLRGSRTGEFFCDRLMMTLCWTGSPSLTVASLGLGMHNADSGLATSVKLAMLENKLQSYAEDMERYPLALIAKGRQQISSTEVRLDVIWSDIIY